jgi:deoxycytidylate deaminase
MRENLLRRIASKSDHKLYRHSAIILSGSRFISQGYNLNEKHAEQMAINAIKHKRSLRGSTLVSFRINRAGYIGNSKPCKRCSMAIRQYKLKTVIYFDRGWHEDKLL